jgi:hypothetical protein
MNSVPIGHEINTLEVRRLTHVTNSVKFYAGNNISREEGQTYKMSVLKSTKIGVFSKSGITDSGGRWNGCEMLRYTRTIKS